MPKLNAAVPKYRRHKANGQAIVTLSGRDHYLGRYGSRSSKQLSDRLTGQWLTACQRQADIVQASSSKRGEAIQRAARATLGSLGQKRSQTRNYHDQRARDDKRSSCQAIPKESVSACVRSYSWLRSESPSKGLAFDDHTGNFRRFDQATSKIGRKQHVRGRGGRERATADSERQPGTKGIAISMMTALSMGLESVDLRRWDRSRFMDINA